MSEQQFQEAKSALAFSQSLRDRLNQPTVEQPEEEFMPEESIQEEDTEVNPMEEKLEVMDEKLDTLLEMEKPEEVAEEEIKEEPKIV